MLSQTGAAKLRGSWDPRVKNIGEKAAGVVTVYVSKGLRMENGVGYPDRVLGTAFQVDAKGYYLTNYHVVSSEVDPKYNGYSRLSIRPSSNPSARIPAKVVGWDEDLDLALLKSQEISSHTFYPFLRGKTAKGQRIYAVGSPVGLENSVTAGIVSATGRRILPRGEAIQIDAPVNPGSSGGPLLDEEGNLAGVIFAGLPGFQGLNFALPVEWVLGLYPVLFEGGKVQASWLGAGIAKNLVPDITIRDPGIRHGSGEHGEHRFLRRLEALGKAGSGDQGRRLEGIGQDPLFSQGSQGFPESGLFGGGTSRVRLGSR